MLNDTDFLLWHVAPALALGGAAAAVFRPPVGRLALGFVVAATVWTAAAAGWSAYAQYESTCRAAGRAGGLLANEPWYRLTRDAGRLASFDRSAHVARTASAAGLAMVAAVLVLRGPKLWRWPPAFILVVACATMVWETGLDVPKIGPELSAVGWHAALGCGLVTSVLLVALAGGRGRWWVVGGIGALVVASWIGRGWTPRGLADAMTQPRDAAHAIGVGVVLGGLAIGRRWTWAAAVGAGVAAWVGVLMMLDGSTGGDPVLWFRGVIVQDGK
ncbi:MAG: hypothetical protein ACAI43_01550 [Phycisphaerae bacterium]